MRSFGRRIRPGAGLLRGTVQTIWIDPVRGCSAARSKPFGSRQRLFQLPPIQQSPCVPAAPRDAHQIPITRLSTALRKTTMTERRFFLPPRCRPQGDRRGEGPECVYWCRRTCSRIANDRAASADLNQGRVSCQLTLRMGSSPVFRV